MTLNSNNCILSYFTSDFPYFCSDNTFLTLFCLMHEAPYNVLGEGQGRTPIVGCQRRWISSLELTVEGQNHRTGLFYASLYTQWLMQSSGTLLRESINVSQEQKRKLVTPSKELCKHSSRPTFASLAFDRHHNNCSGEVVGRSWWVLEAGQRALSF